MPISDVQKKTIATLDKMLQPPKGSNWSENDKLMHEYLVATIARSYVDKYREETLKRIRLTYDAKQLTKTIAQVIKTGIKHVATVMRGDVYRLDVEVSNAAVRLDKDLLKTYLKSNLGMTETEISVMLKDCSSEGKNPESFTVNDL